MIVVTGEARSGTSLVMLIIKKLGFSIAGSKYLTNMTPDMNPTGIWEVKGTPYQPLCKAMIEDKGITEDVIKIMSHKVFQSDFDLIDKLIWVLREPREVMVSQRQQENNIDDETNWAWYNIHMDILVKRIQMGTLPLDNIAFVNYNTLMKHRKSQVKKIAEFLEVDYKTQAAKAVNRKYYRSKANQIEDNPTARAYYNWLKPLCI